MDKSWKVKAAKRTLSGMCCSVPERFLRRERIRERNKPSKQLAGRQVVAGTKTKFVVQIGVDSLDSASLHHPISKNLVLGNLPRVNFIKLPDPGIF
jgi:hypothetical protein